MNNQNYKVEGSILPIGQNWTNGTPENPNILKTFQFILRKICEKTPYGTRKFSILIPAEVAIAISKSYEIKNYMKQAYFSLAELRGENLINKEFNIPYTIYNIKTIVLQNGLYNPLFCEVDGSGIVIHGIISKATPKF